MKSYLSGICGVAVLVCAICVASSAGGADANAHRRANEANERVCSLSATQGTQAEACATEGVALAQGAQAQSMAQTGGVTQTQATDLHLLPRPREVKEAEGAAFKVTQRTRIVVSSALGGREFEGGQMLEDEVEQWTGWKLKISDAREMPGGADFIYIGDATKDSKLRSALEKQGLSMQKGFDEQGYEISADAHRILVGGASAEGAFNGVQTLRQLLRPANFGGADGAKQKAEADSSASRRVPSGPLGMTNKNDGETPTIQTVSWRLANDEKGSAGRTEKTGSSAPFANSATGLGMTNKNDGAGEGGARLVNVALRASVIGAQNKSVEAARNNGASGGGADETAEADSSESRRGPSGPLGMTSKTMSASESKNNGGTAGGTEERAEAAEADPSAAFANRATALGMTSKTEGASESKNNGAAEGAARFFNVALRGSSSEGQRRSARNAKGGEKLRAGNARVGELECPAVAIRDWPAMKWRGVSIDISRGPIPTLKFMENQIRVLAGFKLNMYALYMEDVFTVPGNGIFAPPDALTPDEIRELVSYAQKYYVTVVPELETYGHLHNVLRYDVYSQLAEVPHGSVLTPTQPGSYDLLGKMIAAMAPIFKGPFFHIGADETFELGRGQTKDLIAQKGLGQVYLDHIAKLDEMLKPYHKQTMFWADIAEHFPQLLPTLPKDIIAVIWTYGNADSYDARLQPFRAAGLPIFVSPGISNWWCVYPEFDGAYLNIRNLTRDGQKFGALGMLNTEWKDWGEELGGMDWPGLVFGAACAWQPGESSIDEFRDSYDWAFYRNTDHLFGNILNKLADTNSMLDGVKMNGTYTSYFWADPFSQAGTDYATKAAPVLHDLRVEAEQAWELLLENRDKARANADTIDDLIFAAHRLDVLGMKLEYTQEMSEDYWDAYMNMGDRRRVERNLQALSSMNGDLQDLREEMTALRDDYAKRWRAENREYWLGNVTIRYDTMASAVQEKINEINVLEDDYSRLGELPPPESVGFFARPAPETNPGNNKK